MYAELTTWGWIELTPDVLGPGFEETYKEATRAKFEGTVEDGRSLHTGGCLVYISLCRFLS